MARRDEFDFMDAEAQGLPPVEDPPPGPVDGRRPLGRLVEDGDADVVDLDREADAVAFATGDDDDLSAEEAAVHLTDGP